MLQQSENAAFSCTSPTVFLSQHAIFAAANHLIRTDLSVQPPCDPHHFFFLTPCVSSHWTLSPAILYALTSVAPVELVKGVVLMSVEVSSQHFRGVLCHHCGKPVRVPSIVLHKDTQCQGQHDANDTQFHLVSRVFVLRCRSCERESIYAINQIVDCAFTPPVALDHAKSAAL